MEKINLCGTFSYVHYLEYEWAVLKNSLCLKHLCISYVSRLLTIIQFG